MSPAGVVYRFPEEKVGQAEKAAQAEKVAGQPQPSANATPVQTEAEPVPEAAPAAAAIAPEEGPVEETEPVDIFLDAVSTTSTPESLTTADEWNAVATFEQAHLQEASEKTIVPESISATAETPEHIVPVQAASERERSARGGKARRQQNKSKKSPPELLKVNAEKIQAQQVSAISTPDGQPAALARTTASAEAGEPNRSNREPEPLAEGSV